MWVTFKYGTVHECTWVAFVCVTYQVFFLARAGFCSVPFEPCRETCAATSSEAGNFDFFNYFVSSHGSNNLFDCFVTINCNIFVDVFRIDYTAVSENNSLLLGNELFVFCTSAVTATGLIVPSSLKVIFSTQQTRS